MLSMLHPSLSSGTWCRFSNKWASVKGVVKGHCYKGSSLLSACGKETLHDECLSVHKLAQHSQNLCAE